MSMSKRRNAVAGSLVAALLSVTLLVAGCGGEKKAGATKQEGSQTKSGEPQFVRMVTSGVGSSHYTMTVGMSDIVNKKTSIRTSVDSGGGADASVRMVRDGKAQVGLVTSSSARNGFLGKGQFAKEKKADIRMIMAGQLSARTIVARADAGVKTIADLKGKPFAAKRLGVEDVEEIAVASLKAFGVDPKDVKFIETADVKQQTEAISQGRVAAAIIPGGVPTGTLIQLAQSTNIVTLSMGDKVDAILADMGPAYSKAVIPAGTYKGQTGDVVTIGSKNLLIASADLPDQTVYEITKALFSNYEDLKLVHNEAKDWTVKNSLVSPAVPFHPGAIKYFKEIGAWNDNLDKIQQKLLQEVKTSKN